MNKKSLSEHLAPGPRKKILALDGGGTRGMISLGILDRVESILRDKQPVNERDQFRLCDYYDLIGGTSTGAIIASALSLGFTVKQTRQFYLQLAPKVFGKKQAEGVRKPKFSSNDLKDCLHETFQEIDGQNAGESLKLGSPAIKTGLALFAKRIDTGGVWSITNNPNWRYYDQAAFDSFGVGDWPIVDNKDFVLADLIHASAAAPTFFDCVDIQVEDPNVDINDYAPINIKAADNGTFVDGAMSGRNCPGLQLLFMVKNPAFGFNWETTEEALSMTSVGTGWWRPKVNDAILRVQKAYSLAPEAFAAVECLKGMIHDSALHAITMLQSFSRQPLDPKKRWVIDGEVENLMYNNQPFLLSNQALLNFRRLDVPLEARKLDAILGCSIDQFAINEGCKFNTKNFEREAKAWDETALMIRTRELAENQPAFLKFIYDLGRTYAKQVLDPEDLEV